MEPGALAALRAQGAAGVISRRARPDAVAAVLQQCGATRTRSARVASAVPPTSWLTALPAPRRLALGQGAAQSFTEATPSAPRGRSQEPIRLPDDAVADVADPIPSAPNGTAMQDLSRRQMDVLRLLAAGQSNKQIGRTLGVAESTIKTHLNSLFQRLGVTTRTEAVLAAASLGLNVGQGRGTGA